MESRRFGAVGGMMFDILLKKTFDRMGVGEWELTQSIERDCTIISLDKAIVHNIPNRDLDEFVLMLSQQLKDFSNYVENSSDIIPSFIIDGLYDSTHLKIVNFLERHKVNNDQQDARTIYETGH